MSDKTIKFEIVTPERVVLKEEITRITVPTKNGEITVLPDHVPLVASLVPGVIEVRKSDGNFIVMSLSGGFIEVLKNKVVVLADTAERAEEIDIERAEEARRQAEQSVEELRRSDKERFAQISSKIAKELARTHAAKRWRKLQKME